MIELLTANGNAPFTVALLVMLGLLAFEVVSLLSGFGVNELFDDFIAGNVDFPELPDGSDASFADVADGSGLEGSTASEGGSLIGRMLAWLYVGQVPVLIVLVVFLGVFGLFGLFAQSLLRQTIGLALPGLIAAPAMLVVSLPVVRWTAGGLSKILPKDESNAVSTSSFVGRTAIIVSGNATSDLPSQARLRDQYGTTHYVMVVPEESGQVLERGALILLVRQVGGHFTAIPNPNEALIDSD